MINVIRNRKADRSSFGEVVRPLIPALGIVACALLWTEMDPQLFHEHARKAVIFLGLCYSYYVVRECPSSVL